MLNEFNQIGNTPDNDLLDLLDLAANSSDNINLQIDDNQETLRFIDRYQAQLATLKDSNPFPSEFRFVLNRLDKSTIGGTSRAKRFTWIQAIAKIGKEYQGSIVASIGCIPPVGYVFLDHDGESCSDFLTKNDIRFDMSLTIRSNRRDKYGRYTYLCSIPEQHLELFRNRAFPTGTSDEQFEIRYTAGQTIVAGVHPSGSLYTLSDNPIIDVNPTLIAFLEKEKQNRENRKVTIQNVYPEQTYIDALNSLSGNLECDWFKYRDVLFAAHHAGIDREVVLEWSEKSDHHDVTHFCRIWDHIRDDSSNPITGGTLLRIAKDYGWVNTHDKVPDMSGLVIPVLPSVAQSAKISEKISKGIEKQIKAGIEKDKIIFNYCENYQLTVEEVEAEYTRLTTPVAQQEEDWIEVVKKCVQFWDGESASKRRQINYIHKEFKISVSELKEFWNELESEHDREDRSELAAKAGIKDEKAEPEINRILDPKLANYFIKISQRYDLINGNMAYFLTFLSTAASLIKIGTEARNTRGDNQKGLPIIWSGIIAPPATGKTPILDTVTMPVRELRKDEDKRYKPIKKEYDTWLKRKDDAGKYSSGSASPTDAFEEDMVEPVHRRYYVKDFTMEAIARIFVEDPDNGVLVAMPEVNALFKSLNAYRGGLGSDRENLLGLIDGDPIVRDRAGSESVSNFATSLSITGGIQDEVFAKQIKKDPTDESGLFMRFNYVFFRKEQVVKESKCESHYDNEVSQNATDDNELQNELSSLYQTLQVLPPSKYIYSKVAAKRLDDWQYDNEAKIPNEPSATMKNKMGKMIREVCNFSLVLHLVNNSLNGRVPDREIGIESVNGAIAISEFCLEQYRQVLTLRNHEAVCDFPEEQTTKYFEAIINRSKKVGWVNARDISRSCLSIQQDKTIDAEAIRQLFRDLSKAGKGELDGKGIKLKFRAF